MSGLLAAPVPEAVAEVSGLSIAYASAGADVPVLVDVSLRIGAGEAVGVVGESGCGKSTLAAALVGHLRPGSRIVEGSVAVAGQDIVSGSASTVRALRRHQVGMVPQNAGSSLTPSMRVGRQVVEVLRATRGLDKAEAQAEAVRLFARVRLPDPAVLVQRYPHQLSGGQQQRVAVAIALAAQPRLLVLDEPTTGLDVVTQASVLALFAELRRDLGIALVLVSHDLGAVTTVSDRVLVMYAGRVVESGPVESTFAQPAHPYTRGLLASVSRMAAPGLPEPMPGTVSGAINQPGCSFSPRCSLAIQECTTGLHPPLMSVVADPANRPDSRASACLRQGAALAAPAWQGQQRLPRRREPGKVLLEVRGLTVDYRRRPDSTSGPTVEDVDLTVRRGEIVALVGESGSGKSTIAWTLAGLRTPTGGTLVLHDAAAAPGARPADLARPAGRRDPAVRRSVQLVFQNATTALNPRRSVGDAVTRMLTLRGLRNRSARTARDAVLHDVGLEPSFADRLPGQLSGGQQQRVGIARALAAGPALVLADEVVSALDVSVQASVLRLLDDLRDEHELGYLFISHDLAVVRGLADRVVVLYLGRVCEEGPVEQVFTGTSHPYTRLLISSVLAGEPGIEAPAVVDDNEPESAPPPAGCAFQRRCPLAVPDVCDRVTPPWREPQDGHRIRCHVPLEELTAAL